MLKYSTEFGVEFYLDFQNKLVTLCFFNIKMLTASVTCIFLHWIFHSSSKVFSDSQDLKGEKKANLGYP